jgi:hypothetical protein
MISSKWIEKMAFHVKLSRRPAKREPLRSFTIFCEGENTEPAYFRALERKYKRQALIDLVIEPVGVPMTIAQRASAQMRKRGRNSFDEKDQVWAVFDRDEHPNHEAAVRMCEQNRVGVARSNPCFEVWLILHEREFDRPDGRHAVQRHLKTLRPEYDPDKNKSCDCDHLVKSVEDAEARAARQLDLRHREGVPFGPPSTTVGHLTAAIRAAAQASQR